MSRVEIEGQINLADGAFVCSSSQPTLIDRHPSSIPTTNIRNWNIFCDLVDDALMPLARTKFFTEVASVLFCASILIFVVLDILTIFPTYLEFDATKYYNLMIIPFLFIYLHVYCLAGKNVSGVMEKVKEVCERHCASGAKYRLESEHWNGGVFNKRTPKRYYILVDIDDVDTAVDDVEQQNQTTDMTVSNYFSTTPQQETSSPTTTLADLLK